MLNILIIPPEDSDKFDFIIDLTKDIKNNYPDCCISTVVTVQNYDYFYNSGCIDGFIIEPENRLKKLFLFIHGQFKAVLFVRLNLIWFVASYVAKIPQKINVVPYLSNKNFQQIIQKLSE